MSKLTVTRNTYPADPRAPHAEPGDVVHWELSRGAFRLIRDSDGATVFATAPVKKDGLLRSNGQRPRHIGVVGQVASRGWFLELAMGDGGAA